LGFAMPIAVRIVTSFAQDFVLTLPFESSFELGYYSIKKPPYKSEGELVQMAILELQRLQLLLLFETIIQKYELMPNQTLYELYNLLLLVQQEEVLTHTY